MTIITDENKYKILINNVIDHPSFLELQSDVVIELLFKCDNCNKNALDLQWNACKKWCQSQNNWNLMKDFLSHFDFTKMSYDMFTDDMPFIMDLLENDDAKIMKIIQHHKEKNQRCYY